MTPQDERQDQKPDQPVARRTLLLTAVAAGAVILLSILLGPGIATAAQVEFANPMHLTALLAGAAVLVPSAFLLALLAREGAAPGGGGAPDGLGGPPTVDAAARASDRLKIFHSVIEHSGQGIAIANLDGRLEYLNPAMR
ncbi:MAG: hypothetical protein JNM82_10550, partial [Rhodocyclaceae bacterium]|nr:hypothetical protein [Rhodocyclaceae bacterium]